jgi:hypothetical protein
MEYRLNQEFIWYRFNNWSTPDRVYVIELRSRGHAKLSNGWVIDEYGVSEGTDRIQGGYVQELIDNPPM